MKMISAAMVKEQVKTMAKTYKSKGFKTTELMVAWMNEKGVQPKQIVAVSCENSWKTLVWWEEKKEEKNNG